MGIGNESERHLFTGNTVAVDHDDLKSAESYIQGGFHTIAICEHGIGRSFKHAEELSSKGKPSVFLEGGLDRLNQMSNSQLKSKVIKQIRVFPNREIVVGRKEIRKYSDLIYSIGGCIVRGDPGLNSS
ncbi:MAG: hypothetical protein ACW99F_18305 [Candidatus Hodarchaeales archaeon]|jgi:uncharacterized protein (DUF924 family)